MCTYSSGLFGVRVTPEVPMINLSYLSVGNGPCRTSSDKNVSTG